MEPDLLHPLASGAEVDRYADYHRIGVEGVLAVLDKNAKRLAIDPRSRAERERIKSDLTRSIDKLGDLDSKRALLERRVAAVHEAYGLSSEQRADSE